MDGIYFPENIIRVEKRWIILHSSQICWEIVQEMFWKKIYSKWKSIEFSYTVGRIFHEIVLNIFWIGFGEKYHQDGKALNSHAKLARFCWEIVLKKIWKNLQKKTLNSFAGEAEILFQIPDCQLEAEEGREFPFTCFNFSFLSFPFTFEKLKLF